MEPMFPRLHVKDTTDKGGGPRAPPRNKMALYEQLTVPSPRFAPTNNAVPLPSNLSAQGCGLERQILSPFYMPQVPAHLLDRVNSQSSDGMNGNVLRAERSVNHSSSRTLASTRRVAESSSPRQNEPSTRDPQGRRLDDGDDSRVPSLDQPGLAASSKKEAKATCPPNLVPFSSNNPLKRPFGLLNPSSQNLNPSGKTSETSTSNFKSRNIDKNTVQRPNDVVIIRELKERSGSDKMADRSTTNGVASKKDVAANTWKSLLGDSRAKYNSYLSEDVNPNNGCGLGVTTGNQLQLKEPLCSKISPAKRCAPSNLGNSCSQNCSINISSGAGEKCLVHETPMMESISGLEITPDNVVGRIGPKHFWKARRAIVNQQRVFSIQVFELHRLIKVQKLIAGSPHLLLEGNILNKSSQKALSNIAVFYSNADSPSATVRQKDSQKQDHEIDVATENVSHVPHPNCEDRVNHEPEGPAPNSSSVGVAPAAATPDNKPGPWCFQPTANQWLVPVMSPSEGLVYKPYGGVCPPAAGFMTPIYGSCTPHSATMVPGNFVNQMYGVPPSHRPPNIGVLPNGPPMMPNYYPAPYVLPTVNPLVSASAVEQASQLDAPQSGGQMDRHSRSSCNMTNARSEAFSKYLCKLQAYSELQGSTASSPSEKIQAERKGPSPLFPKFQTPKDLASPSQSSDRNNPTRVIKVVPHNARSASESAARIFRSIQEERQQLDS